MEENLEKETEVIEEVEDKKISRKQVKKYEKEIEDLNKQKWTCIGISCIEDGTFVFLLNLDRGFADTKKQYIFSNDEWNELGKKYGFSNLRKALNYEFWTGMPSGLLSLGMGTPDDFTYTSEHDIYIYGDLYIFVEDQRVVGWY